MSFGNAHRDYSIMMNFVTFLALAPRRRRAPVACSVRAGASFRAFAGRSACTEISEFLIAAEVLAHRYSGRAMKPALVSVIGRLAEASVSAGRPSAARASLMVKMPFDV